MRLRYRLTDTADPEERLEDAAMWKALNDVLGNEVSLYDDSDRGERSAPGSDPSALRPDDILVGRSRRHEAWPTPELTASFLPYWTDTGFLAAAGRFFELHDFEGAMRACESLHAAGKGAFLKSIRTKHWVQRVPLGDDPREVVGEMAYSFIDKPPCLMVQELVAMEYEMRFAVMDRSLVSSSPVAAWLTPLDTHRVHDHVARTPGSKELEHSPEIVAALTDFATRTAASLESPDCILDCCLVDGRPVAIELNALSIGAFGLYAMDVHALARGVRDRLLPRYRAGAQSRISL